jgi:WD40 repeat protein
VAFSPNGKQIAIGAWMEVRILDALTAKPLTPALTHSNKTTKGGATSGGIAHIEFSKDGSRVATASQDETARAWDAATGKPVTPPLSHNGNVNFVSFRADGKRLVTASDDKSVRVWNADTGEMVLAPIQHSGPVTHAWFSPDGKSIATISGSPPPRPSDDNCYHEVRVWDAGTGQPLTPPLRHGARVTWASFRSDSRCLLTASADRTVRLWEISQPIETSIPFEYSEWFSHGSISPDTSLVVTKSRDGSTRVWNRASGKAVQLIDKLSSWVQYLAFSPDGRFVVVAPWGPFVGGEFKKIIDDGKMRKIQMPDLDKNQARVFDAATGKSVGLPLKHGKHGKQVLHAAFSPDGKNVVTSSQDGTARVWEVFTGNPISPPLEHEGVNHGEFSPDGRRVVTAGLDGVIRLWDAITGEQQCSPIKVGLRSQHASFSPDGRQILVISSDRYAYTASLWDASTGTAVSPVVNHNANLLDVSFTEGACRILVSHEEVAREQRRV